MTQITIGKVKVRPSTRKLKGNVKWGREITIPAAVAKILKINPGDILECIVDIEKGLLIYRKVRE